MSEEKTPSSDAGELRQRAEEMARRNAAQARENLESPSSEQTRRTLHELRVHQIELELQNEELRRSQAELDAARARYLDLYDFAPVGYCTVSETGLILEANLTAATLLGLARSALVKQRLTSFILPEDADIYYLHRKKLFETGEPQVCELRMRRTDAAPFWARLEATVVEDAGGAGVGRVAMSDITESKRTEEALQKALDDIRTLRGILPICSNCKKIRDDQGYWTQVEIYVRDRTEAEFSHGFCPACMKELYPEFEADDAGAREKEGGPTQ